MGNKAPGRKLHQDLFITLQATETSAEGQTDAGVNTDPWLAQVMRSITNTEADLFCWPCGRLLCRRRAQRPGVEVAGCRKVLAASYCALTLALVLTMSTSSWETIPPHSFNQPTNQSVAYLNQTIKIYNNKKS